MDELRRSAGAGDVEGVQQAIKAGASANGDGEGRSPMWMAADKGHVEVVKLLLGRPELELNARGPTGRLAFMKVAENGCAELVKLLLGNPSLELNAESDEGNTAL